MYKNLKDVLKKVYIFIIKLGVYNNLNLLCCILSIFFNLLCSVTGLYIFGIIGWSFIILQFHIIFLIYWMSKIRIRIIKGELIYNSDKLCEISNDGLEKYKLEYRSKRSFFGSIFNKKKS